MVGWGFLFFLTAILAQLEGAPCNYKEAIVQELAAIATSGAESKADHKKNLAILYFQDQQEEKAFDMFLEALSDVIPGPEPKVSDEEQKLYTQALQFYLDPKGESLEAISVAIQIKFRAEMNTHPDYALLGFIIASSYANLERFPDYFERFYQSYQAFPKHYLAYKGKAALHAQLFARRRTIEERTQEQEKIIQNLALAIEKNPSDTGLYKMMLVFAPENKKKALINTYLNKIINENIIISRTDIVFYVQQAVSCQNSALAQRFLNKGREWYQNSRTLDAAQQFIKDKD